MPDRKLVHLEQTFYLITKYFFKLEEKLRIRPENCLIRTWIAIPG